MFCFLCAVYTKACYSMLLLALNVLRAVYLSYIDSVVDDTCTVEIVFSEKCCGTAGC